MTSQNIKNNQKPIRSYVRRGGRLTVAQEKAINELWPEFGVEINTGSVLDLESIFKRNAERILEIGFGNGDSLIQMAKENPDIDFLAIEVHAPGIGALLVKMKEQDVRNIRIVNQDAVEFLRDYIADESFQKIQIFFPDPWPKKRHHKRRLIQPSFLSLLRSKLVSGGILHLATDWENYAEEMMRHLSDCSGFHNVSGEGCFAINDGLRPQTKFEKRGQRLGHGVWDLVFRCVGGVIKTAVNSTTKGRHSGI